MTPYGERPDDGLRVVATAQLREGTRHRAVGNEASHPDAVPVTPTLEDGSSGS
ncbi:hypothetical protein [Limnochorda pilosa]|uniref:hypothetical protein n=1 Tax=Limnochorda pilosa TaxID=1555112 RepID=UPI00130E1F48|nr:hypothetical protein [Limnochorda pilosa]